MFKPRKISTIPNFSGPKKSRGFFRKEVIAVDLGGTNLRIALVRNGKILELINKKTPKSRQKLIKKIVAGIKTLDSWKVKGIGIGSPGPLDSETGIIKNPPNLPLRNFNLKKALEKKLKKKIMIENDANCVALAEAKYGIKKKELYCSYNRDRDWWRDYNQWPVI